MDANKLSLCGEESFGTGSGNIWINNINYSYKNSISIIFVIRPHKRKGW